MWMAGKMDEQDQHSGQSSFSTLTLFPNSITEMNFVKKLIHPFFSSLLAVFFGTLSFCDRLNLDLDPILVNRSSPWLIKG